MSNRTTIESPDWSHEKTCQINNLLQQLQKMNIQQQQQPSSSTPQHSFSAEEFVEINPTSQRIWSSQPNPPKSIESLPNIEDEITTQNLYKTELCRSFEETGTCRYGSKCQFAHGRSELRPVLRHPKYKTEVCKTFHTIGTCPYGRRCRFIHISPDIVIDQLSEEESSSPPPIETPTTAETIKIITQKFHNSYAHPPMTLPQPPPSQPITFNPPIVQEKEKKTATSVKPKSILNTNASEWSTTWKSSPAPNIKPIGQEKEQFSMTFSPVSSTHNQDDPNLTSSRDNEKSRLAIFQQFTNSN